jgi:hypothetical protein
LYLNENQRYLPSYLPDLRLDTCTEQNGHCSLRSTCTAIDGRFSMEREPPYAIEILQILRDDSPLCFCISTTVRSTTVRSTCSHAHMRTCAHACIAECGKTGLDVSISLIAGLVRSAIKHKRSYVLSLGTRLSIQAQQGYATTACVLSMMNVIMLGCCWKRWCE